MKINTDSILIIEFDGGGKFETKGDGLDYFLDKDKLEELRKIIEVAPSGQGNGN